MAKRKPSNSEANAVESLVKLRKLKSALDKEVRLLEKEIDELKKALSPVIEEKGDACSGNYIITTSEQHRSGYTVPAKLITIYNVSERGL